MKRDSLIFPLAPAHLAWIGAIQTFIILLFFDATLSVIPLVVFLAVTFTAPFIPWFPYFLPVVSRGRTDMHAVSLTFDDGPDDRTTIRLLDLLDRLGVRATFFMTGTYAEEYPWIVREVLDRGHLVANHSYSHDNLLALRSPATIRREIKRAQEVFRRFGIVPVAFRPPVGITGPRFWRVLLEEGMYCVNFRRRPADFGNSRIRNLAARVLKTISAGDIILLHDTWPGNEDAMEEWLREIEKIVNGLREKEYSIIALDRLCARPVMSPVGLTQGPVTLFYDSIAETFEREQSYRAVSKIRDTALRLFSEKAGLLLGSKKHVLEIGAGTGFFTVVIARRSASVTALDVSPCMLGVLSHRARVEGLSNIDTVARDAERYRPGKSFDLVCSFSALEYVRDFDSLIKRVSEHLAPGGYLYFTTSHVSPVKFFAQVGNALRQGMWLRSRTMRAVKQSLLKAGMEPCIIESHCYKIPLFGGVLIEVMAKKPPLHENSSR